MLKDLFINHHPKEDTSQAIDKLSANKVIVDSLTVRNTKAGISKNILVTNTMLEYIY